MRKARTVRREGSTLLSDQTGRIKPMLLLWAIGIPLPIVLIIALVRGC